MVELVPKWILGYYTRLWEVFNDREFKFKDAERIMEKKNLSVILNELRKSGWLTVKLDEEDARKRIYSLRDIKKIVKEIDFDRETKDE